MSEIVVETTPQETIIEIDGGPTLTTTVEQEQQTLVEIPAEPVIIDLNSGARGEPGSAILVGPTFPNMTQGTVGDMYIVSEGSSTGTVLIKRENEWTIEANIRGPAGGIDTVNGYTGPNVTLTKADVGLNNVDNTSDMAKPISTAVANEFAAKQAIIDTKRDLIFTGGEGATATQLYTDVLTKKFSAQSAGRYIRINTNVTLNASHMISVHITVDGYSQGMAEGWFSAYMFNNAGGQILAPRWVNRGNRNFTFIAAKDSNNKLVLVLDAAPLHSSSWSYPKVLVDQVYSSFGSRNDSMYKGWTASISDDISDLTTTALSSSDNLLITPGTTAQYYRGDKTWQVLDKAAVGLSNVRNVDQVDLTSAQTIGGAKTFTSRIQASGPSVLINNSNDLSSAGAVLQIQNATGSPAIYFHAPTVTDGQLRLNATNSRLQFVNAAGTALATGGIEAQVIRAVTLYGDGSNITAINGSQVTTGTVADARLSTNVSLLNAAQTYSGNKTFTGTVTVPTPTASGHAATKGYIDSIVDAAPGTLDTLNELAAALGDDPNFATTVTNSIATKEPIINAGTTAQYWRGDKTWQTLDKAAVGLNLINNVAQVEIAGSQTITGAKTFSNTTTFNGAISHTSGTASLIGLGIKPSGDHGYISFYSRDAAPSTRTAYVGVGSAGAVDFTIANEMTNGNIRLTPNGTGQVVVSSGGLNVTGTITGNGSGLTALNGTQVTTGTVADARLSTNVALLGGTQTFSGAKTFSALITASAGITATGTVTATTFSGSGASLTALNATNLSTGTVAQARLAQNITRVVHGSTASTARPTGATYVEWIGSVVPTNMAANDTWINTSASGNTADNYPTGAVMSSASSKTAAPTGWYWMEGQQILISGDTALYNELTNNGTVFPYGTNTNGAGAAGTTHFRLPDTRGKTIVHADGTTEFISVGTVFGVKTVTLTAAQSGLPAHTHTQVAHNHGGSTGTGKTYGVNRIMNAAGSGVAGNHSVGYGGGIVTDLADGTDSAHSSHYHSIGSDTPTINNNAAQDAAQAHTNVQPSMVMRYMVKR